MRILLKFSSIGILVVHNQNVDTFLSIETTLGVKLCCTVQTTGTISITQWQTSAKKQNLLSGRKHK